MKDILEAMDTLIQKRHNHNESCNTVKVSRRTQKAEIYVANKGRVLALSRTELTLFFESNVGNEIVLMLRKKTSQT